MTADEYKKPMVRYHVVLPAEMVQRMHEHKERTGVPTAEFVRRAIEAALRKDYADRILR